MKKVSIVSLASAIAMAVPYSAIGGEAANLNQALSEGKTNLSLRLRHEYVDQDGKNEANASTLRTRLTYESAEYQKSTVVLEFEDVTFIGNDNFNDSLNQQTQYALVKDPQITEINQGYWNYKPGFDTNVRWGRQRILLDNQRFVGGVGWRQNEQTYDALTFINTSLPDTSIHYSLVNNVNTITGANANSSGTDLINIKHTGLPFVDIAAYGYLIENVSDTYGVRAASKKDSKDPIFYAAEYASQSDDGGTPYDAGYYLLELGGSVDGVKAWVGYEVQESDEGVKAFSTPFGTNHAFGGWSDQWLNIGDNGLEDIYVGVSTKIGKMKVTGVYHSFTANEGSADDLGSEINLALAGKVCENVNMLVKYANYSDGDDSGKADTQKLWIQFESKF